jgi:hypothetical protein
MADCHHIQALIHTFFLRSFLYSFNIPSADFDCRSAAVWIYQVGYLILLNGFFSLNSYLIVNNLSQLSILFLRQENVRPEYTKTGNNATATTM